jgi:hypothetical protein
MPALAKLDISPAAERGPDVVHPVSVPADWLEQGGAIECELPRRLSCARCEGGGCDVCGRSGVIVMYDVGATPQRVVVHLSAGDAEPRAVRLLEQGGPGTQPAVRRGCLLLRLKPGELSPGVQRLEVRAAREGGVGVRVLLGLAVVVALAMVLRLLL